MSRIFDAIIYTVFSIGVIGLTITSIRSLFRRNRDIAAEIAYRFMDGNNVLIRNYNLNLEPFDSIEERDSYLELVSVFSAVVTVFSVMSFSDSVARHLSGCLREAFKPSALKTFDQTMVVICVKHKLGQILTLNGVMGFLDILLESEYDFTSDERETFFLYVISIARGSVPAGFEVSRDKRLSFDI